MNDVMRGNRAVDESLNRPSSVLGLFFVGVRNRGRIIISRCLFALPYLVDLGALDACREHLWLWFCTLIL